MDLLSKREKQKYETIWNSYPEYRENSAADYLIPKFLRHFKTQMNKGNTIIDFGCGTARTAPLLLAADLKVALVDICENCLDPDIFLQISNANPSYTFFQESLWNLSERVLPADWVVCCDVLEHLPEEKIESVLDGIARRMKKGGALTIALCTDQFGQLIGEPLHLTLKPAQWWLDRIRARFAIQQEFLIDEIWLVLFVGQINPGLVAG